MGVIDKFMSFMKIDGSDDDEDEKYDGGYQDDDDDYVEEKDNSTKITAKDTKETDEEEEETPVYRRFAAKNPQKGKKMVLPQDNAAVCVFKPTNVSESREITNTLRENKTVVLNLEDADDLSAQRILDFTSGSCYALDGTLQKISNYIFIVTPASVEISGDLQDTINESFGL